MPLLMCLYVYMLKNGHMVLFKQYVNMLNKHNVNLLRAHMINMFICEDVFMLNKYIVCMLLC